MTDDVYRVITDNVSGFSEIWIERRWFFGLLRYHVGITSDGEEKLEWASSLLGQGEVEQAIAAHKRRKLLRSEGREISVTLRE